MNLILSSLVAGDHTMRSLLLCLLASCAQASFVTNTLLPRAQTSQRTAVSAITMAQPKGVVITGGAGGVGWAYADEFMRQGHWVVICDVKDPAAPVEALKAKHGADAKIFGTPCDVSKSESVEALGEFAKEKLGTIHYWINNAGINGGRRPFTSVPLGVVEAVVKVNLVGVLLCTHVAMTTMREQKGVTSHVFNTVGSGVKGGGTPGYASYGATKRGLPQFTHSITMEMAPETKGQKDFIVPLADDAHNYWSGYFTSRPALKRQVRFATNLLAAARLLEVATNTTAAEVGRFTRVRSPVVGDSWTDSLEGTVGVATHHDGMSGTERQDVTDDYEQRIAESSVQVEAGVALALSKMLGVDRGAVTHCNCNAAGRAACALVSLGATVAELCALFAVAFLLCSWALNREDDSRSNSGKHRTPPRDKVDRDTGPRTHFETSVNRSTGGFGAFPSPSPSRAGGRTRDFLKPNPRTIPPERPRHPGPSTGLKNMRYVQGSAGGACF